MNNRILFSIVLVLLSLNVYAHGDLHERIVAVTKEIKSNPDSAFLYLKRGELYFQHEEPKKSLKDYLKCQSLGYKSHRLDYSMASTHRDLGNLETANQILSNILAADHQHVRAHRLKGKVLMELEQFHEAALSFERVISYATGTLPENYLEASLAWEKCEDETHYCEAIETIENGISKLGNLPIFYNRLITLNRKIEDFGSVLYYQSLIIDQSQRKESGYYNRALTYRQIGDHEMAKQDLIRAKEAITSLKPRLKNQRATKVLLLKINNEIDEI